MFWFTKSVKFHFRWGTKLRDQKQETGNECDVFSGLQASRKTEFSDILLLPRQWSLGLVFGFLFFFFFFPRSVTNRRLVSTADAFAMMRTDTWNLQKLSSWKLLARIPWVLGRWNPIQLRGRPTLKVVFGKGRSARLTRDQQFTSECFEWIYQESCHAKGASYQPGLSTLHLDKKHLQKRDRIFTRDREPSRIPARTARTHNVWATRAEKLENVVYECVCSSIHLSKTFWETS